MKRRRARKAPVLAVDDDGGWWVPLRDSGIDTLCAFIDGLPMAYFGKSAVVYIRVETALKWFKDEQPHARQQEDKDRYSKAIAVYEDILAKIHAGQIEIKPDRPRRRSVKRGVGVPVH